MSEKREMTRDPVEEHDCEFLSACCGAYPTMGMYETGRCGRCGDPTGFDCGVCGESEELGNTIHEVKG